MNDFRMVEVPPPAKAPIDQQAVDLGLIKGLRVDRGRSSFRCYNCNMMQLHDPVLVWVPDSVRRGDSSEAVEEICRRNAYNGTGSGWCLSCAQALGRPSIVREIVDAVTSMTTPPQKPHLGWFARLFTWSDK